MSVSSLVPSLNICAPRTQLLYFAQLNITYVQGYLPVYIAGCETVSSGLCFPTFLYTSSLRVSFLFFIFLPSPCYRFLLRAHPVFLASESLPQVLHLGNLI